MEPKFYGKGVGGGSNHTRTPTALCAHRARALLSNGTVVQVRKAPGLRRKQNRRLMTVRVSVRTQHEKN